MTVCIDCPFEPPTPSVLLSATSVSAEPVQTTDQIAGWLKRCDQWAVEIGDRLNPILIKETRQALKSRQFVVTFSVLLFAALTWTVVGSLSMMPQIYTSPSAPRMLIGYYIVLAVPMLLVVPLAAYRSLENEIDDGTLELLSITTLSPWQIVLGKLASAMLQMVLYFVALFPCVAYAYNLRGVDLPTTGLMVTSLLLSGILLTIVGLFFAPLARTRSGRISTLLIVMLLLLLSQWGLGMIVIGMILGGNPLSGAMSFYVVLCGIALTAAGGHLLLTATAAQLTPPSENRSTAIRVSLLLFTAVMIGMATFAWRMQDPYISLAMPTFIFMVLGGLWLLAGAMMSGESAIVTPRVRRELPGSFLARATLTFLTPGPVTGLMLACVVGGVLTTGIVLWCDEVAASDLARMLNMGDILTLRYAAITACAYAIALLVAVRWLMWVIRINNQPRVEVGAAALVAVMVLSALIPYSIGLHLNDYRQYSYSGWQFTNWAWTLLEVINTRGAFDLTIVWGVAFFASIGLIGTILTSPKLVFPRRIATPRRVLEERRLEAEMRTKPAVTTAAE